MAAHIRHLPRDSAFARARNGDAAEWTQAVELQAATVDSLQSLIRIYINANSKQPITDPLLPYPRPGAIAPAPEPPKTVSLSGFAGLLKEKI